MIAESDSGRSTVAKQVRWRLAELWSYLTENQTRLINYGRQYLEGHRISTARVESTVDQLVDANGEEAAHALDPTRRADPFRPNPFRDIESDSECEFHGSDSSSKCIQAEVDLRKESKSTIPFYEKNKTPKGVSDARDDDRIDVFLV